MTNSVYKQIQGHLRERTDEDLTQSGQLQQQLWGLVSLDLWLRPGRRISLVWRAIDAQLLRESLGAA